MLSLGSIGLMELEIMAFVISVQIPILFPIPIRIPRFQRLNLQMAFQDELKTPVFLSVNKAFKVGEVITSQKQAVIKLIEKGQK